jgi:5'-3' exonuclease
VALVIDVSHACYRSYYANQDLATSKGILSGHVFGLAKILVSVFRDLGTNICPIFCYDGKGAKAARQQILPTYKANRKILPVDPVGDCKSKLLAFMPGLHVEKEGFEGDDAIAWVVRTIPKDKKAIIFSSDKDLHALKGGNVQVFSPSKGRMITDQDIFDEFHVTSPEKIYLAKSLFGDSSDEIKGVERLLKKQVEPVLEKCLTPDEFYEILKEQPESMSDKMFAKALAAKEAVLKNYQVILPRTEGFSKDDIKRVMKTDENKNKLLETLETYECFSVMEDAKRLYE